MAQQVHSAALHPLATVQLTGAGPLASATLRATLQAALEAAGLAPADARDLLDRVKHADIFFEAGPVYTSSAGQTCDATCMPWSSGDRWEVRNCKELLVGNPSYLTTATVYAAGAYDMRVELYS